MILGRILVSCREILSAYIIELLIPAWFYPFNNCIKQFTPTINHPCKKQACYCFPKVF